MTDPIALAAAALAAAAGTAIGAVFFGGLWWTARRGIATSHPAAWFAASLLVRSSVALSGFYAVGGGEWPRWLACLAGFVAARAAVVRFASRAPRREVEVEVERRDGAGDAA
jgi:F1F0 ATPase subunit 2